MRSCATLAFAVALAACGGAPAKGPRTRSPGRPEVDVVAIGESQEPNARGALSLAVATPADSRAAMLLAHLVATRIGVRAEAAGLFGRGAVETGFGVDGYRVTMPLPSGREAALVKVVRASYIDAVTADEAAASAGKQRAWDTWPRTEEAQGVVAQCRGTFHRSEGDTSKDGLEALRRAAATDAITLGVAGSPASAERVRAALEDEPAWGAQPAAAGRALPAEGWRVQPTTARETRVHVLLWEGGASARAQIALGRMLADPEALAVPVAALGGGLRLERADATLLPLQGACLAVTLTWPERAGEAAVAQAVALVRQRLRSLAPRAAAAASPAAIVEGAAGPAEIAERAALLALAERGRGAARSALVLEWPQTHGEPAAPTVAALTTRLAAEETTAAGGRFSLADSVRAGLPESWLLLASPCGKQGESEQDAGASAAYALAAAARASELAGAAAEPWVEADRVGILLHAGARPGETPVARADRLAAAAARAWLGDGLALEAALRGLERADTDGLLETFAPATISKLPSAPGLGFPEGDAHGALAFGGANLASLRPFGTVRSRRSLREAAVRLRGETLAHGPLAAGYLAAHGGEADRARAVLASSLRSTSPCPAPRAAGTPIADPSGVQIRVPRSGDTDAPPPLLALLRVPPNVTTSTLSAVATYLDTSLPTRLPGALRRHRVDVWGTQELRVLALRLDVPAAARAAATTTLRSWLADLAAGKALDAALWERARSAATARQQRHADDFRVQTASLWSGAAERPATRTDAPAAAPPFATLFAPERLVLVTPDP